jgi:hypothetical protein
MDTQAEVGNKPIRPEIYEHLTSHIYACDKTTHALFGRRILQQTNKVQLISLVCVKLLEVMGCTPA